MHSIPRAEDLDFANLTSYWRGFKKKNIFFSSFRCSICQLVYCPDYFTTEQLLNLYSFMDDNTAGEKGSVLVKTQESYVRNLSEKIEIRGNWLELGGDIGLLTEQILNFSAVVPGMPRGSNQFSISIWTARQKVMNQAESK